MTTGYELHLFHLRAKLPMPPQEVSERLGRAFGVQFTHRILDGELEGFFAENFGFEISLFFHKNRSGQFVYRLNGMPFNQRSREYDRESNMSELIQRWLAHRGETGWSPVPDVEP
jgi:hypothetical protein